MSAPKRVPVLVFPCGTEIGLEVARSLRFAPEFELVGASGAVSNHGAYVYRRYREDMPFVDDPGFMDKLNAVIAEEGIGLVFPAHDDATVTLSRRRNEIAAPLVAPPADTCALCRSKRDTYAALATHIRVPALFDAAPGTLPFPVFLKPDRGQASRGTALVQNRDELDYHLRLNPGLLTLEYLPGREYTVDCFTDRLGMLRYVGARERLRIAGGISTDTQLVYRCTELDAMAQAIHRALPMRGAWYFQAREDASGTPALLEVAARVGGSMGLHRARGVNLPLLAALDALDHDVDITPRKGPLRMDRALDCCYAPAIIPDRVIIDVDSALFLPDGKPNPWMVAFVVQCRNRACTVTAVANDPTAMRRRLEQYGLNALVDALDPVPKSWSEDGAKDALLVTGNPVRRRRALGAGCTVMGPDALDALLDPRL